MKAVNAGLMLALTMTVWAGRLEIKGNKDFTLPREAARGGTVKLELQGKQPVTLRLNGLIVGHFKPVNGVIRADVTDAVNYQGKNTLKTTPQASLQAVEFQDDVPEPAIITRLRKEKIRMNSSAAATPWRAKTLKQAGFNTVMGWSHIHKQIDVNNIPKTGPMITADNLTRLAWVKREIRTATDHGLLPMPLIWHHKETQQLINLTKFDRCVTIGWGAQDTPCPLDTVYWDRIMAPTLKLIAQAYKDEKADGGIIMDQEFYGCGFPGFTYGGAEDGCFCDSCMRNFFQMVGEDFNSADLHKQNRLRYIMKRGYTLEDYLGVLQVRLARKLRAIMADVRSIKPNFLIGVMPGDLNWYIAGIARGMAAPGLPVFIQSESEYRNGYNERSDQKLNMLRQWGFPAFYLPGMIIPNFNAEGLGVKSVEAAQKAAGYWLYYGEMLFVPKPQYVTDEVNPSEYVLRDQKENYLKAMTTANAYLMNHTHPLKTSPIISPLPNVKTEQFTLVNQTLAFADGTPPTKNLLETPPKWLGKVTQLSPDAWRLDLDKHRDLTGHWNITVTPGQKYRMSMQLRAKGISVRNLGFKAIEENKTIADKGLNCIGADTWTERIATFIPKDKSLKVQIYAMGDTGYVDAKAPKLMPCQSFRVDSNPIAPNTQAFTLKLTDQIFVELFNPKTKLAYFRLKNGLNDLRLLNLIYGSTPKAIRLSGDMTETICFD